MKHYLALIFGAVFAFSFLAPTTAEAKSSRSKGHDRYGHSSSKWDKHRGSDHRSKYRKHRKSHRVYRPAHYEWHRGHRVFVPARWVVVFR